MALKVLIDKRHEYRDQAMVSINPKLKRIVIYKAAREMMIKHYGKEFETVLILWDPKIKNAFWLRPCPPEERGARQLNATSDTTRTLSCRLLLQELDWKGTKTERFPIAWDKENDAARVDLKRDE
jgi:hypothetical protein